MPGRERKRKGETPDRSDSGASARLSDDDLFLAEVADATPLRDRDRIPAPRRPRAVGRASAAHAGPAAPPFAIERDGEAAWGRADGVSMRQLGDLRAGRIEPEAEIDLHGYRAAAAADAAEAFVASSAGSGRRCVLVISGRGSRSGGVSPVKEAVLERLSTGGPARLLRAISTAHPRHGGTGALYVALKRR